MPDIRSKATPPSSKKAATAPFARDRRTAGSPRVPTWDGLGRNLCCFRRMRHASKLCLFDSHGNRELSASRCRNTRTVCAWLSARPTSRHGVRIPRYVSTHLSRSSLQSRTSSSSTPTRKHWSASSVVGRAVRVSARIRRRRSHLGRAGQRTFHAEMPRRRSGLLPGAASGGPLVPWDRTIIYVNARAGLLRCAILRAAGAARQVRRARGREVVQYIRDLGVTSVELLPDSGFGRRSHLVDKDLRKLLGLHTPVLAAEPALFRDRNDRRIQEWCRHLPRCRYRK